MNSSKLWEYFIQIVIVIFGVFLGMLLTEWNSNRKERKQQQAVLTQILNEIGNHKTQLENVVPYHKIMTASADSILQTGAMEKFKQPFFENGGWSRIPHWKGIQLFRLNTSGYESAKLSNTLSSMDNDLLESITTYYEAVESYNGYTEKMTDRMFDINLDTRFIDVLVLIRILRGDLIGMEIGIEKSTILLTEKIEASL